MARPELRYCRKIFTRLVPGDRQRPHAPPAPGHSLYQRKNKRKIRGPRNSEGFLPTKENEKVNHLFARLACIDRRDGTIYTDLMGKFPIKSIEGMLAIFILYWSTGAKILKRSSLFEDFGSVEGRNRTQAVNYERTKNE